MNRPLVVIGDAFLDRDLDGLAERLARDGPCLVVDDAVEQVRPGGAGLAALLATCGARPVSLVTALSADAGGDRLRGLLAAAGVTVFDLGLEGPTPEKVRVRSGGRMLLRLDRGSRTPAEVGPLSQAAAAAVAEAAAVLVSDYGGAITRAAKLREAVAVRVGDIPVVWDPHPRGTEPVAGTLLATPNLSEAAYLSGTAPSTCAADLIAQGRALAARWQAAAVAITRSEQGALLMAAGGSVVSVPATAVDGDPCGAGDSFASAVSLSLAEGAPVDDAVGVAVAAAGRFVAAGGVSALERSTAFVSEVIAATPRSAAKPPTSLEVPDSTAPAAGDGSFRRSPSPSRAAAEQVRTRGETVVATGGCFDLLHAGHLSVLRGARSLGDCLVVCLNSDTSVRALKGPGRPVVPQTDREAMLRALPWVDDVIVFDEASPAAVLERLRPHIWAKGGDYAVDDLPETRLVQTWGGLVVTLPYLEGHSTTRLLEQAAHERL
ncbi:MAG: PfkB family carbohydrate kinase [Candidatus Dormibacteria bacterium]